MELCQGRGSWGLGTGSAAEGVGMERAAQGSGYGPECQRSGSVWTLLSDIGFGFLVVLCDPESDLMIIVGSFQLRIFSNSVILI